MTSDAAKAAKWDWISAAWNSYETKGAGFFDWDYDSRTLMDKLTEDEGPADKRLLVHIDGKPYNNRPANLRIADGCSGTGTEKENDR